MTELKCPFCNETELEKGIELQGGGFILGCPKCKKFAHDVFWQALIDTKKKLDIAVAALKEIKALNDNGNYDIEDYDCQVARITQEALEQIKDNDKDVK